MLFVNRLDAFVLKRNLFQYCYFHLFTTITIGQADFSGFAMNVYKYSLIKLRLTKIVKFIGLKYGIIESNTNYFKPAYNNANCIRQLNPAKSRQATNFFTTLSGILS